MPRFTVVTHLGVQEIGHRDLLVHVADGDVRLVLDIEDLKRSRLEQDPSQYLQLGGQCDILDTPDDELLVGGDRGELLRVGKKRYLVLYVFSLNSLEEGYLLLVAMVHINLLNVGIENSDDMITGGSHHKDRVC
jgi:hypothetical protein